MFRKITALFVALMLAFSMAGCMIIPVKTNVELRYDVTEITSIEIFNLGDEVYDVYDLEELIDDNFIPVATLTSESYSDFADGLKKIEFTDTWVLVVAAVDVDDSFTGYVAKVTYANGEYEILSHGSQAYHNEEGHYVGTVVCEEGDWNRFIKEYMEK